MQRSLPLDELAALAQRSQVQRPSFLGTPQGQIAAADIGGMTFGAANMQNAANQANYAQQAAASRANTQGLYGLAGAGAYLGGKTYGGEGWTFGGN
jgi:hypothetical protein